MLLIAAATAAIAERSGIFKPAATRHGGAAQYGDAAAIPGCGRDFGRDSRVIAGRSGAFSMKTAKKDEERRRLKKKRNETKKKKNEDEGWRLMDLKLGLKTFLLYNIG
jgi:hypothetical protein